MRYLALVLLMTGMAFSQPCENWECDSMVVRELLDANGYYEETVNDFSSVNESGRLSYLKVWADTSENYNIIRSSSLIAKLSELERILIYSKEIPISITGLEKLYDINCLWAPLETLPDTICSMINLTRLDVSNSELTSLPDSIGRLKNLEYLDVSNNNLTEIPESIGGCEKLEILLADSNNITVLPESIGDLDKLIGINVESNNIEELPNTITDMDSIQAINISYNNISSLPGPWELPTLSYINVLGNSFTSFPDMVFNCAEDLKILLQFHPDMDTFPEDMSDMKIYELNIAECGLDELPPQIAQIQNLKYLRLNYNKLTTLPYELMENDSLEIFILGNLLNDIPDTLADWLDEHAERNWRDSQRDSVTDTEDSPHLSRSLKSGIDLIRKTNSSYFLNYSLNNESRVDISVYDISGRLVKDIFKGTKQAGNYSQSFKTSGLSAGAYYLRVLKEGSMTVRKFVVMR